MPSGWPSDVLVRLEAQRARYQSGLLSEWPSICPPLCWWTFLSWLVDTARLGGPDDGREKAEAPFGLV